MNEIKSQKAIELLNSNSVKQNAITNALMPGNALLGDRYTYVTKEDAKNAVIIAETEAEERYAKQLQELRDKAVEAFKDVMFDVRLDSIDGKFIHQDYKLDYFTQKLNEK